jgi:hypothetical protein
MASIVEWVWGGLESIVGMLGLTTPLKRFLFSFIAGTGAELWIRPKYAFSYPAPSQTAGGNAQAVGPPTIRPWCGTVDPGNPGNCTWLHVGVIPLLFGLWFSFYL